MSGGRMDQARMGRFSGQTFRNWVASRLVPRWMLDPVKQDIPLGSNQVHIARSIGEIVQQGQHHSMLVPMMDVGKMGMPVLDWRMSMPVGMSSVT